ncbi:hypothetical protein HZS_2535 [Henneguya salminicola]|nr:hypothetical protein HZS_2535 [Henneguya salminicola]
MENITVESVEHSEDLENIPIENPFEDPSRINFPTLDFNKFDGVEKENYEEDGEHFRWSIEQMAELDACKTVVMASTGFQTDMSFPVGNDFPTNLEVFKENANLNFNTPEKMCVNLSPNFDLVMKDTTNACFKNIGRIKSNTTIKFPSILSPVVSVPIFDTKSMSIDEDNT